MGKENCLQERATYYLNLEVINGPITSPETYHQMCIVFCLSLIKNMKGNNNNNNNRIQSLPEWKSYFNLNVECWGYLCTLVNIVWKRKKQENRIMNWSYNFLHLMYIFIGFCESNWFHLPINTGIICFNHAMTVLSSSQWMIFKYVHQCTR